ncbi:MAG TPA: hypothetical protein VGW57_03700 [Chthoniobacterales bacterium]|nr:hypothetical protein [Chthoniobacterales bacterium]
MLRDLPQLFEFVVHLGRDEVIRVRLRQLAAPGAFGHELVLLDGDFDFRVRVRAFDRNADQPEAFPQQGSIGLGRFFIFGLDRPHARRGQDERREELMIHIRFWGPFDFPAENGELKSNESRESEQNCFHRAMGAVLYRRRRGLSKNLNQITCRSR